MNTKKLWPLKPDGWFVKNDCPKLPHYSSPISDDEFVMRNVAISNQQGLDIPDTYLGNMKYVYPGSITRDVAMSMSKDELEDWQRQERIRRGDVCPSTKWWQDLNSGRHGYARGFDDSLDQSIDERNNFVSGWFNAKCGSSAPGGCPYRNPYQEEKCSNPYDPDLYDQRNIPMNNLSGKHYFYSLYDLEKWPSMFKRCPQTNVIQNKKYDFNPNLPERYY